MIGLLTRLDGTNFGTSLQAWALQKKLRELAPDAEVFNYCEYSWRARVKFALWDALGALAGWMGRSGVFASGRRQRVGFRHFEREFIRPNGAKTCRRSALAKRARKYSLCVCGSDQIWNPYQYNPRMFLDFCADGTFLASYAPSIGVAHWHGRDEAVRRHLKRFSLLSVREEQGRALIAQLTDAPCRVVADPALLPTVEEWRQLTGAKPPLAEKPYVLSYFLGGGDYPKRFLAGLKERRGCRIVNVRMFYGRPLGEGDLYVNDPVEFLRLVENAECVCTNSYHGTLFSLLFGREFFTFRRAYGSEAMAETGRVTELLAQAGVPERYLAADAAFCEAPEFDRAQVAEKLEAFRAESLDFLREVAAKDV